MLFRLQFADTDIEKLKGNFARKNKLLSTIFYDL